ncbi:FAD:protein FMN transferase [Rhodovulum strictum]|uniref:FAD:protein FMN transferase n=1 Tax=Rhodovulum strictum TaxID=58314 RepID=A0A844BRN9_9RHOB|nr:FAD:protein FMN transferase [Rhodovulum strictum]MRH22607.1 FAD:protein FMN transferase [Rhodovulum strictum]
MPTRRRLLTIAAAAAACAGLPARAAPLTRWHGVALGAPASIHLAHPQADRLIARALAEIARLEAIFSLHRPDSALVRLNHTGRLEAPPFELLECLSLCAAVHAASGGTFDPTVQPLWRLHAETRATGRAPSAAEIAATLPRIGWAGVQAGPQAITLARPGMALTLNGVAQGLIADKVADLLAVEGLTDILVNTGEFRALGGQPQGGPWPVHLDDAAATPVPLRDRALASSGPLGTTFDAAGRAGHILDPRTGGPAPPRWRLVSVTAPRAGLADALSTAACLLDETGIAAMMAGFPQARLVGLAV